MQNKIPTNDDNSPKGRFYQFNYDYAYSGITDFFDGDAGFSSYASAYAFGAFIARNYGGAKLINEILTNGETNMNSVLQAINSVKGLSFTKNDLLKNYVEVCAFSPTFARANNLPSFNKVLSNTINGAQYSLRGINL